LDTIRAKFARIDECTAQAICEEVDWNEFHAFEAAEEIIQQCQAADLKKKGEVIPEGCRDLCAEFSVIDEKLVALAFIRAGYDAENARDYLTSEPLLDSLKQELHGSPCARDRSACALEVLSRKHERPFSARLPVIHIPKPLDEKRTKTIDLHGYSVSEAYELACETMASLPSAFRKVNFITGRGVHSANGVAKIRPMILHLMSSLGHERRVMEANPGIIEVLPHGQSFADEAQV
jgi:hypothetical protein